MNTARHPETRGDAPRPLLSRNRLTLNEQLCLFGPGNDAYSSAGSVRSWAALAVALVIIPWALIGWTIWMLA